VLVIIDLNELARVAISDGELLGNTASLSTHSQNPNADISREKVAAGDNGPLILVVDDSVTVRKVTSRILKRQGYQVATAKDGVEALKHLQEEVPELMLLDIEMPRMDGFEVAARIRASETLKHLPIIMITSRTGDKHRQRAMEIGVNQYMGKPYQEEQLLEAIDGLLAVQDS
jgi:chemosensory pili system protein ChpA (sensor histidine kinase/response regulator)